MYYCTGEEKASVILFSQKAEEDHFRKSFHSFSEKKKMEAVPRKSAFWEKPRRAFSAKKSSLPGFALVPGQELCQGAKATPARGPSEPGHPQRPSASAGNQRCSVISLSFLSPPLKQTLCNQRHGPRTRRVSEARSRVG